RRAGRSEERSGGSVSDFREVSRGPTARRGSGGAPGGDGSLGISHGERRRAAGGAGPSAPRGGGPRSRRLLRSAIVGGMRQTVPPRESDTRSMGGSRIAPPLPVLITVRQPNSAFGQPFRLERGSCVIGAGAGADLIVDDDTVSRAHVRLEVVREGVLVEDLHSRNGTFYLGQRVQRMTVLLGATIRLGSAEISIHPDPSALHPRQGPDHYGELVSAAPQLRAVFATLQRLGGSLAGVLVEGESGTGKGLIARAIHEHSVVADGPFVAINCAALQRDLVRSELFGHKKG